MWLETTKKWKYQELVGFFKQKPSEKRISECFFPSHANPAAHHEGQGGVPISWSMVWRLRDSDKKKPWIHRSVYYTYIHIWCLFYFMLSSCFEKNKTKKQIAAGLLRFDHFVKTPWCFCNSGGGIAFFISRLETMKSESFFLVFVVKSEFRRNQPVRLIFQHPDESERTTLQSGNPSKSQ